MDQGLRRRRGDPAHLPGGCRDRSPRLPAEVEGGGGGGPGELPAPLARLRGRRPLPSRLEAHAEHPRRHRPRGDLGRGRLHRDDGVRLQSNRLREDDPGRLLRHRSGHGRDPRASLRPVHAQDADLRGRLGGRVRGAPLDHPAALPALRGEALGARGQVPAPLPARDGGAGFLGRERSGPAGLSDRDDAGGQRRTRPPADPAAAHGDDRAPHPVLLHPRRLPRLDSGRDRRPGRRPLLPPGRRHRQDRQRLSGREVLRVDPQGGDVHHPPDVLRAHLRDDRLALRALQRDHRQGAVFDPGGRDHRHRDHPDGDRQHLLPPAPSPAEAGGGRSAPRREAEGGFGRPGREEGIEPFVKSGWPREGAREYLCVHDHQEARPLLPAARRRILLRAARRGRARLLGPWVLGGLRQSKVRQEEGLLRKRKRK
ncbi:protein of unknown function [Methylacidimicrobium sp. AP8]|nr:protein of unknown function [Methylacidimicrobium sp. AP8]